MPVRSDSQLISSLPTGRVSNDPPGRVHRDLRSFAPVPFWSWNEQMHPDEVAEQTRQIAHGGWGGAFIHARMGLTIDYLGDAWFRAVDRAMSSAGESGLNVWLYDEDTWPSGFSGGTVPARGERYRMKALLARPAGAAHPDHCEPVGHARSDLQVYCWTAPLGNPWFYGSCYTDLMEPDAVDAFLEDAYTRYHARYQAHYGKLITAQFTDEPAPIFRLGLPRGAVPYSPRVREAYGGRYGADPLDDAWMLFVDAPGSARFRWRYFQIVSELFEQTFSRRLGEWCEAHGIALTGHFMAEQSMYDQQLWGAPVMPNYQHQAIPGIDHLARQVNEVLTAKQCQSVVNQFGRRRMLSELYGVSGQGLSFADRWWIATQQIGLGVNLLNPHLALYTMAGCRKRDYPPNLFYQQPWWPVNAVIDRPLTRLCEQMSAGEYAAEVLVIHPHDSVWTIWRAPVDVPDPTREDVWEPGESTAAGVKAEIGKLDAALQAVLRSLLSHQRQFDLGDESILSQHARVETTGDVPRIVVGRMSYRALVVPPVLTLRPTTLKLIEAFRDAGGIVLLCGESPTMLNGESSHEPQQAFGSAIRTTPATLGASIYEALPPVLECSAPATLREHVIAHVRRDGARWLVYLVNTSRRFEGGMRVSLQDAPHHVACFDPSTGRWRAMRARVSNGRVAVDLSFAPTQTILLAFDTRPQPIEPSWRVVAGRELTAWTVDRLDDNALVLDRAHWREAGGPWSAGALPVIAIQRRLNELAFDGPLSLRFELQVAEPPSTRGMRLVVEYPDRAEIRINGVLVRYEGLPYWKDIRWLPIEIGTHVKAGANEITLHYPKFCAGRLLSPRDASARYGTEIESLYVIGDFAVGPAPRVDHPRCARWAEYKLPECLQFALPEAGHVLQPARCLQPGDVTSQGLPFYAGRLRLRTTLDASDSPRRLRFERLDAAVAEVAVDGQVVGHVWHEPFEIQLPPGGGELTITLYGTLRNLLGPHHHPEGELPAVAPPMFEPKWTSPVAQAVQDWADGKGAPEEWSDRYALAGFGGLGRITLHETAPDLT